MRSSLLCYYLLFSWCFTLKGQNNTAQALALLDSINAAYYRADLDLAVEYLEQGLTLAEALQNDTLLGDFNVNYSHIHYRRGEYPAAMDHQVKAVDHYRRAYGSSKYLAYALYNLASLQARLLEDIDPALSTYLESLHYYYEAGLMVDVADCQRAIGRLYEKDKRSFDARQAYLSALADLDCVARDSITKEQTELMYRMYCWTYLNLADLAYAEENYHQARLYMQQSQELVLREADRFPSLEREALENEARMHKTYSNSKAAYATYQKLLESLDPALDNLDYDRSLAKLAQVACHGLQQYEQALTHWREVLAHNEQYPSASENQKAPYYREMGFCYNKLQQPDSAKLALYQALKSAALENVTERALIYVHLARSASLQGNYQQAITLLDSSRWYYTYPAGRSYSRIAAFYSDLYFYNWQSSGDTDQLKQSEAWAERSWASLEEAERTQRNYTVRAHEYRNPTAKLLRLLHIRHQKTGANDLLDSSYQLIKIQHALSLKLSRTLREARNSKGDTALLARYEKLQQERMRLQDRYQQSTDSLERALLNDSLRQHEFAYESVQQTFNQSLNEAPSSANISLKQLQQAILKQNAILVQYFRADSTLYLLGIRPDSIIFHSVKRTAQHDSLITKLARWVRDPASSPDSLGTALYRAYDRFLAPVLRHATTGQHIYLLPDAQLHQLPWAALCTHPPEASAIGRWPYLIKQHPISFLSYAEELLEPVDRQSHLRALCIAPTYAPPTEMLEQMPQLAQLTRDEYWPLPGAQAEAHSIIQLYGDDGTLLTGTISADRFLQTAATYNVWHLAQHSISNPSVPEQSRLLFPSQGTKIEALSALRLLSAAPSADLAVLGACYTGEGTWKAGEGALSLAYILRQTDVQSVVSSQWAVADQQSSKILTTFHEFTRQRAPLNQALANAQLDYLSSLRSPAAGHPFYWAGYQILGSTQPLGGGSWWWMWGGLAIGLLGWIWLKRK